MNTESTQSTITKAEEYLDRAQEGYCKPEEDLVPYMICRCAYKSVASYLSAYLINHDMTLDGSESLESLLKASRELDPQFESLNLDPLFYGEAHQDEAAVASPRIINEYLKLATQTRDLITTNLK